MVGKQVWKNFLPYCQNLKNGNQERGNSFELLKAIIWLSIINNNQMTVIIT